MRGKRLTFFLIFKLGNCVSEICSEGYKLQKEDPSQTRCLLQEKESDANSVVDFQTLFLCAITQSADLKLRLTLPFAEAGQNLKAQAAII